GKEEDRMMRQRKISQSASVSGRSTEWAPRTNAERSPDNGHDPSRKCGPKVTRSLASTRPNVSGSKPRGQNPTYRVNDSSPDSRIGAAVVVACCVSLDGPSLVAVNSLIGDHRKVGPSSDGKAKALGSTGRDAVARGDRQIIGALGS